MSQKGARHETVIKPALQHVPDGDHDCNSFLFPGKRHLSAYFTASRQMGQDTNDLNMAVNQSENIAELLTYSLKSPESSSMDMKGTSGFLTSEYPDIAVDGNCLTIYYDASWNCCTSGNATYYIEVRKTQEESLCVFCIDAYKTSEKKKPVYSLNVSLHPPLHP